MVTRVLLAGAITMVLGLGAVPLLFTPREQLVTARIRRRAFRTATWTALAWLVFALASLYTQTADASGGTVVTAWALTTYVGQFSGGQATAVQVLVAVLALMTAARGVGTDRLIPARLLVICAGIGVLLLVTASHVGALSEQWHDLAAICLELHMLAAALWTGGLAALTWVLARERALLACALPRYSRAAGACLATVTITGLFTAAVSLSSRPGAALPSDLLSTDYGRLVLAKTACLALLGFIAAHQRYQLLPRIRQAYRTSFVTWACCELAVMGSAFGLAATLGRIAT